MGRCLKTLQLEAELDEIVKLVGVDALSADDRLTLEVARSIREDFLQQNAFDSVDSYTTLKKQYEMMNLIHYFEDKARAAVKEGVNIQLIADLPVRERIGRAKAAEENRYREEYADIKREIDSELKRLIDEKTDD